MFASKSLLEHVARGLLGGAAFVAVIVFAPVHPWALGLLPVGFVLLRGCPACWTIGLFETVAAKLGKISGCRACSANRVMLRGSSCEPR